MQKGTAVILLTGAVATLMFAALIPFASDAAVIKDHELHTSLRFISQSLLMFVSFGVFFINWLPPNRLRGFQSAFISGAFLSTGLLTFAHILTCRELLSAIGDPEDPVGSYFHMISSVMIGVGLAVAAFIPAGRRIRKREMSLLISAFLTFTVILITTPFILGHSLPSLCPHDAPDSLLRISVESTAILALAIGTAKYYMLDRKTKEMTFAYLASATVLGISSHVAFSLHDNAYDIYSALSVVFAIGCYGLVFLALFRGGVIQPYERLTRTQDQAERRRKEAEAATVKAQTYLDFLSHDVANMISPIMNRAEMILHSPNVSDKEKEEARKIVEQTQKVSSLIVNLRRLSSAEKIDAKTLGPVDLRAFLPDILRTRREGHPDKDLRITVNYADDPEIKVVGGSVAEDIIAEVIDNSIKHSKKRLVEIEVHVYPSKADSLEDNWNIEISDHGPGIPDHTKMALDVASPDPKRRFTRGIASSLSVIPLIAEQLGGRIRIEDRVPGDYTQGTKVVFTLPKAS